MIRREAALLPQSRSEASDFLDEDSHLVFLNGAGAVLVELLEAGVEVSLGELTGVVHFAEGVLNEFLGLISVEGTGAVLVVLSPDIVNALSDNSINVSHLFFLFGKIN